jgi:hypothetical protein
MIRSCLRILSLPGLHKARWPHSCHRYRFGSSAARQEGNRHAAGTESKGRIDQQDTRRCHPAGNSDCAGQSPTSPHTRDHIAPLRHREMAARARACFSRCARAQLSMPPRKAILAEVIARPQSRFPVDPDRVTSLLPLLRPTHGIAARSVRFTLPAGFICRCVLGQFASVNGRSRNRTSGAWLRPGTRNN